VKQLMPSGAPPLLRAPSCLVPLSRLSHRGKSSGTSAATRSSHSVGKRLSITTCGKGFALAYFVRCASAIAYIQQSAQQHSGRFVRAEVNDDAQQERRPAHGACVSLRRKNKRERSAPVDLKRESPCGREKYVVVVSPLPKKRSPALAPGPLRAEAALQAMLIVHFQVWKESVPVRAATN
jgi:hypothetical protein